MGDSDDEVDKRNVREKFKHERSDYDRHESRKSHDATDRYLFTPLSAIVLTFPAPVNRIGVEKRRLGSLFVLLLVSHFITITSL